MGAVELLVLFVVYLVIAVCVVRWGLRTKKYWALLAVAVLGLTFVLLGHRAYNLWKSDNLDEQVSKFWIRGIVDNNPGVKRQKATLEPQDPVWLGTRSRREVLETPSGNPLTLTVYYRSTVLDSRAEKADLTFDGKTVEIPAEVIQAQKALKLTDYFPAAFEKRAP